MTSNYDQANQQYSSYEEEMLDQNDQMEIYENLEKKNIQIKQERQNTYQEDFPRNQNSCEQPNNFKIQSENNKIETQQTLEDKAIRMKNFLATYYPQFDQQNLLQKLYRQFCPQEFEQSYSQQSSKPSSNPQSKSKKPQKRLLKKGLKKIVQKTSNKTSSNESSQSSSESQVKQIKQKKAANPVLLVKTQPPTAQYILLKTQHNAKVFVQHGYGLNIARKYPYQGEIIQPNPYNNLIFRIIKDAWKLIQNDVKEVRNIKILSLGDFSLMRAPLINYRNWMKQDYKQIFCNTILYNHKLQFYKPHIEQMARFYDYMMAKARINHSTIQISKQHKKKH